jgi:nucleoside-diphosphate-sugar epimerase
MANIMVTGAAGFIAFHAIHRLLTGGHAADPVDLV